jgi:hypothetical protein
MTIKTLKKMIEIEQYQLDIDLIAEIYNNNYSLLNFLFYNIRLISEEEYNFYDHLIYKYHDDKDFLYKYYCIVSRLKEIDIKNSEEEIEYIEYSVIENYDYLLLNIDERIETIYKEMPYQIFLRSSYWQIVSEYKKEISGHKCQLCISNVQLNTHHNNYKNRGQEYKNLNDLIVLCSKCHSKFHNK